MAQQKMNFAEMRGSGVRGLLIYCSDYHCSRSFEISADRWPDDIRLSDLEPRFICEAWPFFDTVHRPRCHEKTSPFLYAGKILQMPAHAVLRPHARIYCKAPLKPEDID